MLRIVIAGLGVLAASSASAHRPLFPGVPPTSADTAAVVERPYLSQVMYHEVAEGGERMWLTFEGEAGQELFLQIGLPVIDRLRDLRPVVALVGPGLPEAPLPFPVPNGCGAETWDTEETHTPRFFHERFTGTDSWILLEERVSLPAGGQYYLVGYLPSGETGKFWLALGTSEEWGVTDVGRLPPWTARVRRFHEVRGWPLWQIGAGGTLLAVAAIMVWRIGRFVNRLRALRPPPSAAPINSSHRPGWRRRG
ncbi:MAG: hypothetical protein PVF54_05790 [Anaerolineae bacterium]|jgi:hypothetical protein